MSSSLERDEMVLLYVEEREEPYKVQRALLTRVSKWFERALSNKFVEGQKLELRFPDTTTETLQLFLYWQFEGRLPQDASDPALRPVHDILEDHLMYVDL